MANYNDAVITTAGQAAVADALVNGKVITFTRIGIGDGKWTDDDSLQTATALKNELNSYGFTSKSAVNEQLELHAVILNYDAETTKNIIASQYYMNELGVFCKIDNGPEILYSITTAAGLGDALSVYDGSNPIQVIYDYVTTISADANIKIILSPFATQENISDLQKQINALKKIIEDLQNGELKYQKVASLPTGDDIDLHTIYMVASKKPQEKDKYIEWMYMDGEWERVGSTSIIVDSVMDADSENPVQNKAITAVLTSLAGSLADSYSNAKTYKKGDTCIHDWQLWTANQDIDPAEEWTEAHWDKTTMVEAGGGSGASVLQLKITFAEAFKGAQYTITGGSESYSGTVPDSLQVVQKVEAYNTTYTISSTANGTKYSTTAATEKFAGEYTAELNAFTATINVTVTAAGAKVSGATATATLNGKTYTATTNSSGVAAVKVYSAGTYAISATYRDYAETSGSSVAISTNEQIASGSVAIFGATLTVDADISGRTSSATNTITVTDGTHKQTATITANGSKVFTIYYVGTYTVSMTNGTDTSASVSVDCKTDGGTPSASISYFKATLTVKVINGNGATVTATDGAGHTYTGTATSGSVAMTVYAAGTYTVSSKLNGTAGYTTKKVEIKTNGGSYSAAVLQSGATFSAGSDEVIGAMIDAAQDGDLDLKTLWAVGDTRTISVAAFAGVQNQHAAQSIDIVITSFEDYNNAGAVMQFDMKDGLAEYEYMNSSNTGTLTNTSMYKTVLPNYANALPSWLKTRLKPFSIKVSPDGSDATPITLTNQKLALRAEWEVFGAKSYAVAGQAEASGNKQVAYYATQSNRVKKKGHSGSANWWWLRSPYSTTGFCDVSTDGGAGHFNASGTVGCLAPFGCV